MKILIGSTFPLVLIRRPVFIEPVELDILFEQIKQAGNIYSFWGHSNTIEIASKVLGVDLTPDVERPAIKLNEKKLPVLYGEVFKECWVLSPNYVKGFRPQVGIEVTKDKISGWDLLNVKWVEQRGET